MSDNELHMSDNILMKMIDERCEALNAVHDILTDIRFFTGFIGGDKVDEWSKCKKTTIEQEVIVSYIRYKKMTISSIILPLFDSANDTLTKAKDMKIDDYIIHMRTFLGEENKVSRKMLQDAEKYIGLDTDEMLKDV